MSEPVLTVGQLNRALLARQLLLDRSTVDLASALEQLGGLSAPFAPSAYIGLWTRLADFDRTSLTQALEQRAAVQAAVMRQTWHVVAPSDFGPMAAGVRRARREWWLRVARSRGLAEYDYQLLADKLRTALQDGPMRRQDLLREIDRAGYPRHAFEGVALWLDLLRVPPQATWDRPQADLFALAQNWLGPQALSSEEVAESEGLDFLLRRYLRAFGPGSLSDAASWAGVPARWFEPSADRLDLRRFRHTNGATLFDLPYGPIPDADVEAPVRFLPSWDATLLVHARRANLVPEHRRDQIFGGEKPNLIGTFLVDGVVAGTWRCPDGVVIFEPFEPLTDKARVEVESEAANLAEFHR